mmetsp:Transcript_97022/g.230852  ORF Transcript_97022/g.230852 Transcript_97022/m.230852 type:complete len:217 (+) Transcript_97022:1828-2478(+)
MCLFPLPHRQTTMVASHPTASKLFREKAGHALCLTLGHSVHDGGAGQRQLRHAREVLRPGGLAGHAELQVGPVEGAARQQRGEEAQALLDVLLHPGGGSGRERHHRHLQIQPVPQPLEPAVGRPEVVSPLGDAVGLINRHQQQRRGGSFQLRQEAPGQLLRSQIHQAELPRQSGGLCARVHLGRAQEAGAGPALSPHGRIEAVDLVLHQGNQRRDH